MSIIIISNKNFIHIYIFQKTMKKLTFTTLFLVFISLAMQAQDVSKQLIGKWKLSDLKIADKAGKDLKKMTSEQKKNLDDIKPMFLDGTMVMDFMADGSMTSPMTQGKKTTWKIVGKQLEMTTENEDKKNVNKSRIKVVNGIFEMIPDSPRADGTYLVFVFKK